MPKNSLRFIVLALAGISLLPLTALPTFADGSGKEVSTPKEKDDTTPKDKTPKDKTPKDKDEPPKEPEDHTERDGPPVEKPGTPRKKTRHAVVERATPSPVHAYKAAANYCPAGLQPVSIAGEVSCGKPNQSLTYQQMLAHPTARPAYRRSARPTAHYPIPKSVCGVGMKGCSDR